MNKINDYEICLSIQRALLDAITLSLRRVSFSRKEGWVILHFYYDGEPSELEKELVGDVSAEVISDFPNCNIDCEIQRIDYPIQVISSGRIVFSRYEKKATS